MRGLPAQSYHTWSDYLPGKMANKKYCIRVSGNNLQVFSFFTAMEV